MPELPEVETVRRTVSENCSHKKITKISVFNDCVLDNCSADEFIKALEGASLVDTKRRGKYLTLLFDNSRALVVHLRMTGQLFFACDFTVDKHTHLAFEFENGGTLYYRDVRKFGRFWLFETESAIKGTGLEKLGLEPFDEEFSSSYVYDGLCNRSISVKTRILDQSFIAGIGNIYADEILFAAEINPLDSSKLITRDEAGRIAKFSNEIMGSAIENRGTTFRDYRDGNGEKGGFQNFLKVFGKCGEPCPKCGTVLVKTKCNGRGTTYCPVCQKERKL